MSSKKKQYVQNFIDEYDLSWKEFYQHFGIISVECGSSLYRDYEANFHIFPLSHPEWYKKRGFTEGQFANIKINFPICWIPNNAKN